MTNLVIYCFILFNLTFALASNDKSFRSKKFNFIIKKSSNEELSYTLFNQDNLGLVLGKKDKKNTSIFSPGNQELKALDLDFSKIFVKHKYLTKPYSESKCNKLLKPHFYGNDLSLCSEDKVKVNELISFINKIENKLVKKIIEVL